MRGYCNTSRPSGNRLLLLATTNENKFFEIRTALGQIGLPLYSLNDFPHVPEAVETGETFEQIALAKAQYYWQQFARPVISEDSGLVIPSLGGYPGIHSARIASDDRLRIELVLQKLKELELAPAKHQTEQNARYAYYICNMVFIVNGRIHQAEGKCEGRILPQPDGDMGFGYDPIFQPLDARVSFGRMSIKQKTQYSHRARAVQMLLPDILSEFRQIRD